MSATSTNHQKLSTPQMIAFLFSLVLVLPIAGFFIWLDIASGMWKDDLGLVAAVGVVFGAGVGAYFLGRRLRKKFTASMRLANLFLFSIFALALGDLIFIVIAKLAFGLQSWLLYTAGLVILVIVILLLAFAMTCGALPHPETAPKPEG